MTKRKTTYFAVYKVGKKFKVEGPYPTREKAQRAVTLSAQGYGMVCTGTASLLLDP